MGNPLQAENYSLRRQLESLLFEARCNEDKMRRFDLLERRLIGASSLVELVRLLLSEYRAAFGVECVTLALVDPEYEAARILEGEGLAGLTLLSSAASLESIYGSNPGPLLGPFDPPGHGELFESTNIASVALLPLVRQEELIGSLHFGSADPERYDSLSGTRFLERLAAIISVCLGSALNQERLKLIGLTDALTGVQNRRYFEHRCQIEARNARRHKQPLACMFLDIDRFKRINDTCGHQVGDEVLRSVAGIIQSQLRAGDTIARYGGEEFVVMLPLTPINHAKNIAERIRERISIHPFGVGSGQVTISIGLSMLAEGEAEEGELAGGMIASADKALYQAKHGGRNQVVCHGLREYPRNSVSSMLAGLPGAWSQAIGASAALCDRAFRLFAADFRKRLSGGN